MIIFDDFEPKKIILRAITDNGKEISIKAYIDPKEEFVYPEMFNNDAEHVRKLMSTHKKCEDCGNIIPISDLYYGKVCRPCNEKKNHNTYLSLPVVDIEFPIFIDDEFIEDEDHLNDFILEHGIDKNEIHNAKRIPINFDLTDSVEDFISEYYEDGLRDLLSTSEYERLVNLEMEVNNLLVKNLFPMYEPDYKTRVEIKKES